MSKDGAANFWLQTEQQKPDPERQNRVMLLVLTNLATPVDHHVALLKFTLHPALKLRQRFGWRALFNR